MKTSRGILAAVLMAILSLACMAGRAATGETAQAASAPAGGAEKLDMKKELRILYIGNSYTSVNNLPKLLSALLAEDGRKVAIGEYLAGGMSFRAHWNQNLDAEDGPARDANAVRKTKSRKGQLDKLLAEKDSWDFAVFQGQSMETLSTTMETAKYAGMLVEKVRQANSKTVPVFYQTWARQHLPDNQAEISKVYMDLARQNKALIAPVGEAWKAAFAARQGLVLHSSDKSHPNPMGTYLAGCVFYATITGKSPVGLPGKIESMKDAKDKLVFDLSADDAKFLQEIAWATVQRVKTEMNDRK